ncbi:LacI family DNA-binding transcriptional regulator [Streptomyces sp. NPDC051940]|uniref:LacI family DNA-binding transcriptional regulator n=1 Tax=Streptomyces sp. NPDC051940 TaxID=3155675 RepID=UPI0034458619
MAKRSRPTVRDVAQRAEVSVATVSVVLNNPSGGTVRVAEETRRRVLAAAADLGYVADQAARGLRRGKTEQLCLVMRWPDSPWAQQLATDVSRFGEPRGYSTLMFVGGDWRRHVLRRGADGVIVDAVGQQQPDFEDLRTALRGGLAMLVLNDELEPDGFDVLATNEYASCREAVELLVAAGHRRIGCLRQRPEEPPLYAAARFAAWSDVLRDAGLPHDDSLVRDGFGSRERAYTEAVDLLTGPSRPTAVFATSDQAAISVIWAARHTGLSVPDDLAVIGVGNAAEGRLIEPGLTTVGPAEPDFTAVAERLFRRITEGPELPGERLRQHWSLIRRGTA